MIDSEQNRHDRIQKLRPQPSLTEIIAGAKLVRRTPFGLQDGNGTDISLIVENLKLTPEQRWIKAFDLARRMAWERSNAKRID